MKTPRTPPDRPGADPGKRPTGVGGVAGAPADDEEEWRHEPVAPVDEANPLKSLGKAVGDTVTGSGAEKTPRPEG